LSLFATFGRPEITLERWRAAQAQSPRRRRFSDNPVVTKRADGTWKFGAPFHESIVPLFTEETGITPRAAMYGPFCLLESVADRSAARDWQEKRQGLIFLRDLSDISLAIDFNLSSPGVYTRLGQLEHDAKVRRDQAAIKRLCTYVPEQVAGLGLYREADAVVAMPSSPDKEFVLPRLIAAAIAKRLGIVDLSSRFNFARKKPELKTLEMNERWQALEQAGLSIDFDVSGKRLILIDDKYQSGTSSTFAARILYQAGAECVYSLACVKTWRDSDNK
jgi:adenine/guanine phosphoribosyltransferase-like PRPP-binding protein